MRWWSPRSLQGRLMLRLMLVFAVAVSGAAGLMVWRAAKAIDSLQDRALQSQAADIIRHLSTGPGGARLDLPRALLSAYAELPNAYFYAVYSAGGAVLSASSPQAAALLSAGEGDDGFFQPTVVGSDARYYAYATTVDSLRVAVAQSTFHADVLADSLFDELVEHLGWMVVLLVLVTLVVVVLTIRGSLRPLTDASAAARRIGPATPEIRLPEQGLPSELRPLIQAINRAVERLGRAFRAQQAFTADAAHELRTPLAVLTARIDALPSGCDRLALQRDVRRMNRLVEQLLRAARLDAAPLDIGRAVDLREVVVAAISSLAPLAIRDGREIALSGAPGPIWVHGDAAALGGAVTNLIENALVHTPPPGGIQVELDSNGRLRVMDRGPGVPAADREAVFERFRRGAAAGAGSGAGLGLAIVAETARQHGGTIMVEDRPGGGSVFTMQLRPFAAGLSPHDKEETVPAALAR